MRTAKSPSCRGAPGCSDAARRRTQPRRAPTVNLTATPDPANAEPSSGVFYILQGDTNNPDQTLEYPFQASFTLTMAETGGRIRGHHLHHPEGPAGDRRHHHAADERAGGALPVRLVGERQAHCRARARSPSASRSGTPFRTCGGSAWPRSAFSSSIRKGTPNDTSDDIGFSQVARRPDPVGAALRSLMNSLHALDNGRRLDPDHRVSSPRPRSQPRLASRVGTRNRGNYRVQRLRPPERVVQAFSSEIVETDVHLMGRAFNAFVGLRF